MTPSPQPTTEAPICITPNCGKPQLCKGICRSCYGVARKLIDQNRTTWEHLQLIGAIQEELKPFEVEFNKRAKVQPPSDQ